MEPSHAHSAIAGLPDIRPIPGCNLIDRSPARSLPLVEWQRLMPFFKRRYGLPGFLLLLALAVVGCDHRPKVTAAVTPERIRQVRPGMSEADVVSILGAPLHQRSNGPGTTYDYAVPGLALRSFSFWVAFDARGRVDTVRVEEDPLLAEAYAIYDARPGLPVYEHPQFVRLVGLPPTVASK